MADGSSGPAVLYVHGLESGPKGRKARWLAERAGRFEAVDMGSGVGDLGKRNSFARHLLKVGWRTAPWRAWGAALSSSLEACVALQAEAIERFQPDVVVGSSFGGAVTLALLARGHWAGPTVLLCPAHRLLERRAGRLTEAARPEVLEAGAAGAKAVVVHGDADDVVPLADSQGLAAALGVELVVVEGADHGLKAIVETGALWGYVEDVLG